MPRTAIALGRGGGGCCGHGGAGGVVEVKTNANNTPQVMQCKDTLEQMRRRMRGKV